MGLLKSLRSFFRRTFKHLFRKLGRTGIIVIVSVAVGAVLTTAVVYVLLLYSPGKKPIIGRPSDISVSSSISDEEADTDDSGSAETIFIEVASENTKIESTEETALLTVKENAQKGYMNRCVFLGDSRTVAMVNYGLLNDDAALAEIGISHPSFKKNRFVNNAGKEYTLSSYLESHQAPVIYIALGVNGINDANEEHYKSTYIDLIDTVMNDAPNSNVVLMSIGPVNDNGMYKRTVQNSWIRKYNDFLLETAKEKHIFYLNISEVLTGDDGQVKPEYNGGDGLHYSSSGCQAIFDYIVSHPVPGIADDGEYTVRYIKPNPKNTKVTMDEGSGIDEAKLQELLNMMMQQQNGAPQQTTDPAAAPTPAEVNPAQPEQSEPEKTPETPVNPSPDKPAPEPEKPPETPPENPPETPPEEPPGEDDGGDDEDKGEEEHSDEGGDESEDEGE